MIVDYELRGRLDSNNTPDVEKNLYETLNSYQDNEIEGIAFEANELDYISSSGLKMVLKCRKKYDYVSVNNVSDEVYDVFEMVGFDKIIDISKKTSKIK